MRRTEYAIGRVVDEDRDIGFAFYELDIDKRYIIYRLSASALLKYNKFSYILGAYGAVASLTFVRHKKKISDCIAVLHHQCTCERIRGPFQGCPDESNRRRAMFCRLVQVRKSIWITP